MLELITMAIVGVLIGFAVGVLVMSDAPTGGLSGQGEDRYFRG